jgi:hypothetical protein
MARKSIKLNKKYGLNPTISKCFVCGKSKDEIVLLGNAYKEEAPMEMVIDKEPCDKCKERMKQGIIFIGIRDGETDNKNPYRTGELLVMKEEGLKGMDLTPEEEKNILKNRIMFIEQKYLKKMGFYEALEEKEKNERK